MANADVVGTLYERLFQKHGAPLVMKADNGSQFRADEIKEQQGDIQLGSFICQ